MPKQKRTRVALEFAVEADPVAVGCRIERRVVALKVIPFVTKVAKQQKTVARSDLLVAHVALCVVIIALRGRPKAHLARDRHLVTCRRNRVC